MRRRVGAVVVLVLALAGCTPQPDPSPAPSATRNTSVTDDIVGAYGDLHVAPDGSMMFCYSDPDPGFTGIWRECQDGIRTTGVDQAALDAELGTGTTDPGGYRWVGAAAGKRTTDDGTDVYSVFLAGTRTDDTFSVTSVGEGAYRVPPEYQELLPGVPGGFLVRLQVVDDGGSSPGPTG